MSTFTLYQGDCLDKLKELEENSIDSIVTDPPYGLSFMGKKWDYDVPSQQIWEECIRVLKPGGHLLAFAGSRTYHRMAVRIEDAGFDIRDQIMWIYGSGFPKSHNVALAIDKQSGKTGHRGKAINVGGKGDRDDIQTSVSKANGTLQPAYKSDNDWNGWGTALKPAHEPIVMARKPFKGSVAENVLEWGTGGINVDGCRIGTDDVLGREHKNCIGIGALAQYDGRKTPPTNKNNGTFVDNTNGLGRFPANIIFDEEAGKLLDEQSGVSKSSKVKSPLLDITGGSYNNAKGNTDTITERGHNDTGGASRFFYCPKSSKKDRNEGMTTPPKMIKGRDEGQDKTSVAYKARPTERQNIHPTVKPTELMTYLIRLVTPPNGIVLDPFMGSGSTGKACMREGFQFVGIEREEEYMEIAQHRIEWEYKQQNPHDWF